MYTVACMSIWDDDANLKLSIMTTMKHVDEYIFLLGPYKDYPLYVGQTIEDTNEKTRTMIYNLMGKKKFSIDNNMSAPWKSEMVKRNRYMELMDTYDEHDLWMLIIDSDELLFSEVGLPLAALSQLQSMPNKMNFISLPIWQHGMMYNDIRLPIRLIRYPTQGSLRYKKTHYHIYYDDMDGKDTLAITDAVLWDIGIWHLVGNRPQERIAQQEMYYQQVVEQNLEKNALYKTMLQYQRE